QSRFHRRNRHRNVDVVAVARKQRVLADADDHIEIADATSAQPGIAFTRDPNALPVAGSGLDANLQRIGALDAAFAMTDRAGRNIFARPMAARASDIEFHPPAGLLNRPFAVALRTYPRSFDISIAVAVSANIAARDIELHHPAANRRPERHVDLVLEIASRLRSLLGSLTASASSKNAGKNI